MTGKKTFDFSYLRLTDAVQLINSTPHGQAVTYEQLRLIREAAGFRIASKGGNQRIDLRKLARYLFTDREKIKPKVKPKENKQIYDRNYQREKTTDKQEIGPPPKRKNKKDWARACEDFQFFCKTYKPDTFDLDWSPDHLEVIELCKAAMEEALMYALAMPRGSGKSAIFQALVEWAILTGRKRFTVLVAATGKKADELMSKIKRTLNTNVKLQEDFAPELYGIVALENESRRCSGQRCLGNQTGVQWLADRIVMPTVPESRCSGSIIVTSGIESAVVGFNHVQLDGKTIRPDICFIDDPQTLASARSFVQSKKRIDVLHQSIRGLAGPKKGISMVMACTKMFENDLACQILDHKKYSQWKSHTFKMMHSFPDDMKLWEEYKAIRTGPGKAKQNARDFYKKHRDKMDAGASMYWPERYRDDESEISGIQCMMNLYYENQHVFWSEYQNEPQSIGTNIFKMAPRHHVESLCVEDIEGIIPDNTMIVVGHIDIHKNIHYGTASAFAENGMMRKCWHGTFPNQGRLHFEQRNPPVPIPSKEIDAPIIDELVNAINFFGKSRWTKPCGVVLPTTVITIDMRWGVEYVLNAMINSNFGAYCLPYMGMFISPDNLPIKEYTRKPGDTKGDYWYHSTNNEYQVPIIKVDVNAMKEKLHTMLLLESGKVGSVSLGGGPPRNAQSVHWNSMLIDHLLSKEPVFVEGKRFNRTKLCFVDKDGRPDDHYFDCLVANLTMADVYGCRAVRMPS